MIINAIKCPTCGDIIYSRARHDFRWCGCGEVAIDGGFEYSKVCFKEKPPERVEISVDATKQELYDDWNKRINVYGRLDRTN